jgi:hypothetical protein
MKLFKLVSVVGVILLAFPLAVHAQSGAIGLGPVVPIGPNPHARRVGYQVGGGLEFGPAASPFVFRLDALFDRMPFRYTPALPCAPPTGCAPQTGHEGVAAATFNVVIRPSAPGTRFFPYLIAGAGVYDYYDTEYPGSNAGAVGVNTGLGLRLPFLHAFVEARAHFIRHAPDCLPITFGVRF